MVNRGPNAILFGIGEAAGIVDVALSRPSLRRNANTAVLHYGSAAAASAECATRLQV